MIPVLHIDIHISLGHYRWAGLLQSRGRDPVYSAQDQDCSAGSKRLQHRWNHQQRPHAPHDSRHPVELGR